MSTDKCVSMLVEVKPCSDRVGSLVVVGLLNDSKKSDETWKVPQTLRFQVCYFCPVLAYLSKCYFRNEKERID